MSHCGCFPLGAKWSCSLGSCVYLVLFPVFVSLDILSLSPLLWAVRADTKLGRLCLRLDKTDSELQVSGALWWVVVQWMSMNTTPACVTVSPAAPDFCCRSHMFLPGPPRSEPLSIITKPVSTLHSPRRVIGPEVIYGPKKVQSERQHLVLMMPW